MPLEFIDLGSSLVVTVPCNNQKAMRKKNGSERGLK